MKTFIVACFVALSFALTGCGANYNVGSDMVGLAISQYEADKACNEAYAKSKQIDCTGLSDMNCFMLKSQAQNVELVAVATGNSSSPCGKGTNLFDVMNSEVKEKNATARTAIGTAGDVTKFAAGVYGATKIVDSIGQNAGNRTTQYTEGGDASVSNSKTITNTKTISTNTGEEGTSTAGSPSSDPVITDPVDTTPVPGGTEVVPVTEITND